MLARVSNSGIISSFLTPVVDLEPIVHDPQDAMVRVLS
jgi:hypothetical protein